MRARIRDAAVELFGEKGFERATVREIAQRAGASPGLVLHHFGSKDGLREACDEHVITTLLAERSPFVQDPRAGDIERVLAAAGTYRTGVEYLARLMSEPGDASARVFDAFLEHTRETMRDGGPTGSMQSMSDPDVTALLLTAYGLAPIVLGSHFRRVLGVDPLSPTGARIMAIPGLEVLTRGVYGDDSLLRATEEALGRGMGPRSDKGDGDPNQDPDPPMAASPSDPTT